MRLGGAKKLKIGDKVCLKRDYFDGSKLESPYFTYGEEYVIVDIQNFATESSPDLFFYLTTNRGDEMGVHYEWLKKSSKKKH